MKNLRERIGLKILRLIDRYIDSFEKRIFIFIIFITMYWLWQNIWQLLLFYKVYFITDYESLFNLQAHLSNYESSVLIRIIYYVISNPSLNMAGLVSCIKLIDIMGIVGLFISYYTNVATGPMIVIIASVIFFATYFYGRNR